MSVTLQQKVAWFNLAVSAAAVLVYVASSRSWARCTPRAPSGSAPCGGSRPFFYRSREGQAVTDERAQVIAMLAARGLRVFWEVFVAACMITWAVTRYHYHRSVVPVDLLPALVLGGFVVYEVTQSIAVVIQYRRTGRREE